MRAPRTNACQRACWEFGGFCRRRFARERPVVLPQPQLVRTPENASVPIGGGENLARGGKQGLDFQAIPRAETAFEADLADQTEAAQGGMIVEDVIAGAEPTLPWQQSAVDLAVKTKQEVARGAAHCRGLEFGDARFQVVATG